LIAGSPPPIEQQVAPEIDGKNAGIASIQRIGGSGGLSIKSADPLFVETQAQAKEIQGMRTDLKNVAAKLTKTGSDNVIPIPVFGSSF
jgi:hypothetical protein